MYKKQKTNLNYWEKFLKKATPTFIVWLEKENSFLRKRIPKGAVVLDVGCGLGRNIEGIINTAERIVAIDNDKTSLKEIRRNLLRFKNVEFFLEDAQKMHFKNNTFDYIICMGNTFGNFGLNKVKILKEMKRVLKRGGEIIVSIYSEKALPLRLKVYKEIMLPIKKIDKDGTIFIKNKIISEQFSKGKLENIFKRAGLSVKIKKLGSIAYLCESSK